MLMSAWASASWPARWRPDPFAPFCNLLVHSFHGACFLSLVWCARSSVKPSTSVCLLQAVGMPLTIPLSDDAAPDASLQWSIAKGVYADISFKGVLQHPDTDVIAPTIQTDATANPDPAAIADMLVRRDDDWNKKLYGEDVQPEAVLEGLVCLVHRHCIPGADCQSCNKRCACAAAGRHVTFASQAPDVAGAAPTRGLSAL